MSKIMGYFIYYDYINIRGFCIPGKKTSQKYIVNFIDFFTWDTKPSNIYIIIIDKVSHNLRH